MVILNFTPPMIRLKTSYTGGANKSCREYLASSKQENKWKLKKCNLRRCTKSKINRNEQNTELVPKRQGWCVTLRGSTK